MKWNKRIIFISFLSYSRLFNIIFTFVRKWQQLSTAEAISSKRDRFSYNFNELKCFVYVELNYGLGKTERKWDRNGEQKRKKKKLTQKGSMECAVNGFFIIFDNSDSIALVDWHKAFTILYFFLLFLFFFQFIAMNAKNKLSKIIASFRLIWREYLFAVHFYLFCFFSSSSLASRRFKINWL